MNRTINRGGWPQLVGAVLIVASGLLAVGGCATTVGGTSNPGMMAAGLKGFPGEDEDDTQDYMRDEVDFGKTDSPETLPLPVTIPCASCPGGRIKLLVSAEARSAGVSWERVLSANQNGFVVAMVKNVDNVTYSYLKLAPGQVAYKWVGQIDSTRRRGVAWFKIDRTSGRAMPLAWTSRATICTDPSPGAALQRKAMIKYKPTHDDNWNCRPITAASAAGSAESMSSIRRVASLLVTDGFVAAEPRAAMNFAELDDLWIGCPAGCCESDGTAAYN